MTRGIIGYGAHIPYYRLQRYAFPLLIALLWGLPALFQIDPIGAYFRHTVDPIFNLLVPR